MISRRGSLGKGLSETAGRTPTGLLRAAVLLSLGWLLLFGPGCTRPDVAPTAPSPRLDAVSPASAREGTLLVLRGSHLGSPVSGAALTLDGVPVAADHVHAWGTDRIAFWLPSSSSSGLLRVSTPAGSSNALALEVLGPSPTPEPRSGLDYGGSLSGTHIVVSPGHGYYHTGTEWTTQRGETYGLIEDVHTNEIAMDYLIPMLERAGARVHSCRERSRQTAEVIVDDEDGAPAYAETGAWSPTASSGLGYGGGDYRYAAVDAAGGCLARWTPDLPRTGDYPVWVWYCAASNRSAAALFTVHHAGGDTEVRLDQRVFSSRWVYLGTFRFRAGEDGWVTLSNASGSAGDVVIADAMRFGAGMGSIVQGGTVSGQPRWLECSTLWTRYLGAPESVWNHADYNCRPRFANWLEDEWGPSAPDAYLSLHTNAAHEPDTGTGTSSFIAQTSPSAGSAALQQSVHDQLVSDIRALWDAGWVDRGKKAHDYGEVYHNHDMPAVLLEIAFHDTATPDNAFLHLDRFRSDVSRALLKGLVRFFDPADPVPPLPPRLLSAVNLGHGRVEITWSPRTDPLEPTAVPQGCVVYAAGPDGGFDNGRVVAEPCRSLVVDRLEPGRIFAFRVAAWNAGGESLPSETLCVRVSAEEPSRLLLVQGFDRLDRFVRFYRGENRFDAVLAHAEAVGSVDVRTYHFDAASNEAVAQGAVGLDGYAVVDWILGEESTADETFSVEEQEKVRAYVSGGGSLLVTGSEVAWDLGEKGTGADRLFLSEVLRASYASDDAEAYEAAAAPGSLFEGAGPFSFDDGTHGVYDVDSPDVLAPAGSEVCLLYEGDPARPAGIRFRGRGAVVYLGFPLEAVWNAAQRTVIMERVLRFLDSP